MKKQLLTFSLLLLGAAFLHAQIIFEEDFEGGALPMGWIVETNATDGGWNVGTPGNLSSQYLTFESNGSSQIIATNDDGCDCDKSADFLTTPKLDFTGIPNLILRADVFYGQGSFQNSTESAEIAVSTDSVNWTTLAVLEGAAGWNTYTYSLDAWAGINSFYISFRYSDDGGWLFGMALDNIVVERPPQLDAEFTQLNNRRYGEIGNNFPIKGKVVNNGTTFISSLEFSYTVNGGTPVVELLDNMDIPAFSSRPFAFTNPWIPTELGMADIVVEITAVNGTTDENPNNNTQSLETEIFEQVVVPNKIDEYLVTVPILEDVATSGNQLDRPTDLDFFPILALDEVWVVNQRTENAGGSTLTISNASTDSPEYWQRVDGNSWHFMSLPTGIAFDPESFNFGTSPGVQDANHGGGTFTGPTLWSSDPDIYAQPSGGNGSHIDMLHGSPLSMGIAHEVDNAYWIYDNWNKDIVRYDFKEDHGPGNDYHGDATVYRYSNTGITADGDIPSHIVLDKETGWLYIVDNGNDRVIRMDINSGIFGSNLPEINETLAEHTAMTSFTLETIIEDGLDRPCGIEIMENRLLVSDYATGEIIIYDMDNAFEEMGRIPTESPGITGIKVGPTGDIWYTNRILNTLTRAEPGEPLSSGEQELASLISISPNPTTGSLIVRLPEFPGYPQVDILMKDVTGQMVLLSQNVPQVEKLELGDLPNGVYLLSIVAGDSVETRRVVVSK